MKIEAQLIELTAWRGELANILLAIAVVILFGIVAAMIQERWPGITRRAIGWLSLFAVCGPGVRGGRAARAFIALRSAPGRSRHSDQGTTRYRNRPYGHR